MPTLGGDPMLGRWVIISTERAQRPTDFRQVAPPLPAKPLCPLCPGNEAQTPSESLAYRATGGAPNTSGWSLRVIPNKFPALRIERDLGRDAVGVYDRMNGVCGH